MLPTEEVWLPCWMVCAIWSRNRSKSFIPRKDSRPWSKKLRQLDGEVRIVMEHTGRYYESFAMTMHRAGFFVSAVNPLLIKNYQGSINVRKVKTDKADAQKNRAIRS